MLPPSAKPYLVRAIYDWCLAEGHSPYILAAEHHPGVRVPDGYAKDGRITLNINPRAVQDLEVGADHIRFSARFGAAPFKVQVPYQAVVAVFASETHEGMVFGDPHSPISDATQPAPNAAVSEPDPMPNTSADDATTDADGDAKTSDEPRLRLVE
jgi:stringent starvation protein B